MLLIIHSSLDLLIGQDLILVGKRLAKEGKQHACPSVRPIALGYRFLSLIDCNLSNDCASEDLPHGRPPPELPPRSPTSADGTPSLPPNQPDLLRQISAQGAPQSNNEGKQYNFVHQPVIPGTVLIKNILQNLEVC